jgi:uncharacterized protein YndB with AHSA1/START domain
MRTLIALLALLTAVPAAGQDGTVSFASTETNDYRSLLHAITIPAPIEDVWLAVSTEEGWAEWGVPLARALPGGNRFETSYDLTAAPGAPSTIEQEWLIKVAPRAVAYRTTRTPAGFPESEAYLKVVSIFLLEEAGEGATKVTHVSQGFPHGAAGDTLVGFFTEGNALTLRQLHERFVSGPRDWSAAE